MDNHQYYSIKIRSQNSLLLLFIFFLKKENNFMVFGCVHQDELNETLSSSLIWYYILLYFCTSFIRIFMRERETVFLKNKWYYVLDMKYCTQHWNRHENDWIYVSSTLFFPSYFLNLIAFPHFSYFFRPHCLCLFELFSFHLLNLFRSLTQKKWRCFFIFHFLKKMNKKSRKKLLRNYLLDSWWG